MTGLIRCAALTLLVLPLSAAVPTAAADNGRLAPRTPSTEAERPIRFDAYRVDQAFSGRPVEVDLSSHPDARTYRTRLRKGARAGPNFAGHYALVEWGAGSSVGVFAIVDLTNGRVFIPTRGVDMSAAPDVAFASLWVNEFLTEAESGGGFVLFRPDSRLLVVQGEAEGLEGNTSLYDLGFYEWKGDRLRLVRSLHGQPRESADMSSRTPSFDCAKASTAVEKAICKDEEVADFDRVLNNYYQIVLEELHDAVDCLRADQRAWLRNQRDACGTKVDCLRAEYLKRLATLDGFVPGAATLKYVDLPREPSLVAVFPPVPPSQSEAVSTRFEVRGRLLQREDGAYAIREGNGAMTFIVDEEHLRKSPSHEHLRHYIESKDEESTTFLVRGWQAHDGGFSLDQCRFVYRLDMPEAKGSPNSQRQLITSRSVGPVRFGMTVAEASKALSGFSVKQTKDAEGFPVVTVERDGEWVMDIYSTDEQPPLSSTAKVTLIRVGSSGFATAEGVGPGTPLAEVERTYGKVTQIILTELEGRETAEFARQPSWFSFQIGDGNGSEGGLYPSDGGNKTVAYKPSAQVIQVWVHGG